MEFLKEPLGEELYTQVAEKLQGSTIKLVDLSAGKYVGADKHKALETERDGLKAQISEVNKQIESFKSMDIDGIKKAADDWKIKYEADMKTANEKMAQIEYDSVLRDSLSGVKFSSELAKKAAFNELKTKGLKRENDKILGLDDALKELQEKDVGAFVIEESNKDSPPPQPPTMPNGTLLFQPDGTKPPKDGEFNFNFTPIKPVPKKE